MNLSSENPVITTIITTYRRPQLLRRAVESVLKQTYPHFQVYVCDNASGDETEEIMRDFVARDSRVQYHRHPENIGMMANYKFALNKVNTPFFSFLSDDDFLLPWFFETALNRLQQHPDAAFAACSVLAVDDHGKFISNWQINWNREGYFNTPEGLLALLKTPGGFPIPAATLFQQKQVKNIIPEWSPEMQLRWDTDYFLQIAAQHPIVVINKPCAVFFVHECSFSSTVFRTIAATESLKKYIQATDKITHRLLENPHISLEIKEKVKKALFNIIKNEIFSIYLQQHPIKKNVKNLLPFFKIVYSLPAPYSRQFKNIIRFLLIFCLKKYVPYLYNSLKQIKNTINSSEKKKVNSLEKLFSTYQDLIDNYLNLYRIG